MLWENFWFQNFRGPKTTLQQQRSQGEPRSQLILQNFCLPASCFQRCVVPMLFKNFRFQNFRGPSWTKKVPKTHRESREFTTTFGSPRSASNPAWRPCLAKIFVSKIFAGQVGERRFRRRIANTGNFPWFLAPRVAPPTLRGAHAFRKFPFPKFCRTMLDTEFQRRTANPSK